MFPYEIKPVEATTNAKLLSNFQGAVDGFCQIGPQKWLLPLSYAQHAEGFYTMPIRDDDIWIVTYPRTGTTMCQELVWLISNNYDYTTASNKSLECRVPFYEFNLIHNEKVHKEVLRLNGNHSNTKDQLKIWSTPGYVFGPQMDSPRHLKTHLPFSLLPPGLEDKCKVLYLARNPKDVAVSFYHHNKTIKLHDFCGDFKEYWEYFEKDLLLWCPFWEHVKEGWEKKHKPNVLFLFYEELVQDMPNTIKKLANFLNKPITNEQVDELVNHLHIDKFRKNVQLHKNMSYIKGFMNTKENHFIRKGKVGDNDELTEDLKPRIEAWIEEHLSQTDMKFPV